MNYVINCCGKQVPNHWAAIGLTYLTYNWRDSDDQIVFDSKVQRAFRFIDSGLLRGDSVLIHSLRGQGRSCCLVAGYLMYRYRWSLQKSLEFLKYRRPGLSLRPGFLRQLQQFEVKLLGKGGVLTSSWNGIEPPVINLQLESASGDKEAEELILRNTFLNAQKIAASGLPMQHVQPADKKKVRWNDAEKGSLVSVISRAKPMGKPPVGTKKREATRSIMKKAESSMFPPGVQERPVRVAAVPGGEKAEPEKESDESLPQNTSDFLDELDRIGNSPVKQFGPQQRRPATGFRPVRLHDVFTLERGGTGKFRRHYPRRSRRGPGCE